MVMNSEVIKAVKQNMQDAGVSQGELAKRIGIERPNLTRLLSGRSGRVPDNWQKILNELGLELTVQKKGSNGG